jgi:ribulose-5-phosphate 4-epimerase/fuculose-1-phosphate aldolase
MEEQLLEACRRLAAKGFLNSAANSFSMRIPGTVEMILVSGLEDWEQIGAADLQRASLLAGDGPPGLHASIYQSRADVGAIAITSPKGVRLLARLGLRLPPLFDEQVRHLGSSVRPLPDLEKVSREMLRKAFLRGANAAVLGEQLLCLGMTCGRLLFNTELYEKCAQAYVLAKASGARIKFIPLWVRLIAYWRLLNDERRADACYRTGEVPGSIQAY